MNYPFSDITIINGGLSYNVHRYMLSKIPYFMSMLMSGCEESNMKEITTDLGKTVFERILKDLYGESPFQNSDYTKDMFTTLNFLGMDEKIRLLFQKVKDINNSLPISIVEHMIMNNDLRKGISSDRCLSYYSSNKGKIPFPDHPIFMLYTMIFNVTMEGDIAFFFKKYFEPLMLGSEIYVDIKDLFPLCKYGDAEFIGKMCEKISNWEPLLDSYELMSLYGTFPMALTMSKVIFLYNVPGTSRKMLKTLIKPLFTHGKIDVPKDDKECVKMLNDMDVIVVYVKE